MENRNTLDMKTRARDLHYALIETCGLPDDPKTNAAARNIILAMIGRDIPEVSPGRRPPFDGADIFRLNRLAEEFPQYESSTRWKRLWPFIAWALEVPDQDVGKKGGPEAPETAALQEARDAVYKLTTAALIFGNTDRRETMMAKEKAIEGYQKQILAALEAAPASVKPKAEPSPNLDLYRDENKHITRFKKETP